MTGKGDEIKQENAGRKSNRGIYIKAGLLLIAFIITAAVITVGIICYFYFRGAPKAGVLSFVPEEAHIVANFDTGSALTDVLISDQYKKAYGNEKSREMLKKAGDTFLQKMFFGTVPEGIELTEDFLNYVKPEGALSFFNVSQYLASRFPEKMRKEALSDTKIHKLGIFHMDDKEKVKEFFEKVNDKYKVSEKEMEGYKIFVSEQISYVFKDEFVLLSTHPELLVLSLKTIEGKHKSLLYNDKFRLFKKKVSSDTTGFVFLNVNYLRKDLYGFLKFSDDSQLAGFFNSFKLIGGSLSISEEGALFETLILPEEKLTSPLAKKFFSQEAKEPSILRFFPEDGTTNVIVITNALSFIDILQGLFEELVSREAIMNFVKGALHFGLSEQDIITSLTGEVAVSLPVKSMGEISLSLLLKPGNLAGDVLFMAGIEEDSKLANYIVAGSSFISMVSPPTKYRDVNIVNGGTCTFALTGGYIIVNTGQSHSRIEESIKASLGESPSLYSLYQKRAKGRFPSETTGVTYFNTKLMFENFFRGLTGDNKNNSVNKVPEVWFTTTTAEKGYKSTLFIPLVLFKKN